MSIMFIMSDNLFQSTHPARGATAVEAHPDLDYTFQSTHPARGATSGCGHFVAS